MGALKVWWVFGWDNYYPGVDNFECSFYTKEEADQWIKERKAQKGFSYDNYTITNIEERL